MLIYAQTLGLSNLAPTFPSPGIKWSVAMKRYLFSAVAFLVLGAQSSFAVDALMISSDGKPLTAIVGGSVIRASSISYDRETNAMTLVGTKDSPARITSPDSSTEFTAERFQINFNGESPNAVDIRTDGSILRLDAGETRMLAQNISYDPATETLTLAGAGGSPVMVSSRHDSGFQFTTERLDIDLKALWSMTAKALKPK